MPILTKLYTMEEASQHNTKDDCWVVIDGKVYDLTSYLDDHPGGDDVVIASTAKDATDDFEDAGHSESARELMQNYFIGEIENFNPAIPASKRQLGYAEKLMDLSKQPWAIAAAVVGVSLVVGFLLLRKK